MSIDRRSLVDRHAPRVTAQDLTSVDGTSPLSVGNGEFAFTVDVTGLQTFPEHYPVEGDPPGTLLATMAQWGWHSMPGGEQYDLAEVSRAYDTPRGPVEYVDMVGDLSGSDDRQASDAEAWLRANPHRLDLARIGLVLAHSGRPPTAPAPADLRDICQRLDLWNGCVTSRFRLLGAPVRTVTACDPQQDLIAVRVESDLLAAGLAVRLAFPYGSQAWGNAADWSMPEAHTSTMCLHGHGATVERSLDATAYLVDLETASGRVARSGRHELLVSAGETVLDLVVRFRRSHRRDHHARSAPAVPPVPQVPSTSRVPSVPQVPSTSRVPSVPQVLSASSRSWEHFWTRGAAVELAGSSDQRAGELERRVVLSQYLTAVHCAGSFPPQETGLMANSWRGRFHLEMHWWHGAHFPLWGRGDLLERSLGWYSAILPVALLTARRQGYAGARWPKQVAADGRESPSPIGPFLLWQQPHPIFLAELVRRCADAGSPHAGGSEGPGGSHALGSEGHREVLRRYAEVVMRSAEFMADVVTAGQGGYQLGPPLVPAQESYAPWRARMTNPTFELAYWAWALSIAQRWRVLLGLDPDPRWDRVAAGMARPSVVNGLYTAVDVPPFTLRGDHPSMLYALGFVPRTGLIDDRVMRATLRQVMETWPWETTWGWDYPAIAMTATRLGDPATAVRALMMPVEKNAYLANGHNRQAAALPVYLPANGGLLSAVAMMVAGCDAGSGHGHPGASGAAGVGRAAGLPGFPDDGTWTVRAEGLHPMP